MDKQNILKHIERWLDIRQKNARIGFKGMEEIHLLMKNFMNVWNMIIKMLNILKLFLISLIENMKKVRRSWNE